MMLGAALDVGVGAAEEDSTTDETMAVEDEVTAEGVVVGLIEAEEDVVVIVTLTPYKLIRFEPPQNWVRFPLQAMSQPSFCCVCLLSRVLPHFVMTV
jgi:hypothetical protein